MSPDEFKAWRKRMEWTQLETGVALGLSRNQVINFEKGVHPVSKVIQIACNCLENHNIQT